MATGWLTRRMRAVGGRCTLHRFPLQLESGRSRTEAANNRGGVATAKSFFIFRRLERSRPFRCRWETISTLDRPSFCSRQSPRAGGDFGADRLRRQPRRAKDPGQHRREIHGHTAGNRYFELDGEAQEIERADCGFNGSELKHSDVGAKLPLMRFFFWREWERVVLNTKPIEQSPLATGQTATTNFPTEDAPRKTR